MIKLNFVGDVQINSSVENRIDDSVLRLFKNSDFNCINLEGPITTNLNPDLKAGPNLCQNENIDQFLDILKIDIAFLANNHIMDFGASGLFETIKFLENKKIQYTGAAVKGEVAYIPLRIEKNNIKLSIFNFSETQHGAINFIDDQPGYAKLFDSKVDDLIIQEKTEQSPDYIIIYAHGGLETVDVPIKFFREKYDKLINLGVDCIIGSHPHRSQGYKNLDNSFIFYSLGDFIFDYSKSGDGLVLELIATKDNLDYKLHSLDITNNKISLANEDFSLNFIQNLNNKINNEEYLAGIYKEEYKKQLLSLLQSLDEKKSLTLVIKDFVKRTINNPTGSYEYKKILRKHIELNETYQDLIKHNR